MNEETNETLPSQRLAALGIALPPVAKPVADYVPALTTAGQIYTSGQLPFIDGKLGWTGKVGAEVSLEQATQAARTACLNALAAAADQVGGVDGIQRVVKLTVYVASAPDFTAQPSVGNGASAVLIEVLGPQGQHTRSAVGVAVLPLDSPVEVELILESNAASF
ncbi:MAG: RidA family protein [Propionibacteriaceae bacterium]|jgi:enamine deaminase RidA (YjgF/YER057c/UK114 family)|nr:RidA family protein [Propionibacteriaceae bacterium]